MKEAGAALLDLMLINLMSATYLCIYWDSLLLLLFCCAASAALAQCAVGGDALL